MMFGWFVPGCLGPSHSAYLSAGVALFGAELQFAVQVDVAAAPGELEDVEREEVGGSQSVSHHLDRLVDWVGTSAHKHT